MGVLVAIVVMMVVMPGDRRFIGPALRLERRAKGVHVAAKPYDHVRDHMIGTDPQRSRQHLHRQMAVPKVPGDAHERMGVRVNVHNGFFGGDNTHNAVRNRQAITVVQAAGLWQVQKKFPPGVGDHQRAPAMPVIEIEPDRVDLLRIGPFARRKDLLHRLRGQNRKYRCAIGNTDAGSQVSSTPSARTS
jgi:hypothetical protein